MHLHCGTPSTIPPPRPHRAHPTADASSRLGEAEFARLTLEAQVTELEAKGVRLEADLEAGVAKVGRGSGYRFLRLLLLLAAPLHLLRSCYMCLPAPVLFLYYAFCPVERVDGCALQVIEGCAKPAPWDCAGGFCPGADGASLQPPWAAAVPSTLQPVRMQPRTSPAHPMHLPLPTHPLLTCAAPCRPRSSSTQVTAENSRLASANATLQEENEAVLGQLRGLLSQAGGAAEPAAAAGGESAQRAATPAGASPAGEGGEAARLQEENEGLRAQLEAVVAQNADLQERLMALAFQPPAEPAEGAGGGRRGG